MAHDVYAVLQMILTTAMAAASTMAGGVATMEMKTETTTTMVDLLQLLLLPLAVAHQRLLLLPQVKNFLVYTFSQCLMTWYECQCEQAKSQMTSCEKHGLTKVNAMLSSQARHDIQNMARTLSLDSLVYSSGRGS